MGLLFPARLLAPLTATRPRRVVVRLAVGGLLIGVVAEAVRVMALSNRHTVIPGRVYRTAQPTAGDLHELIDRHGIRTVVNLRGLARENDPAAGWYFAEAGATHDRNVSQEDVTLSANRLPPPAELRRLIEVLDRTEYPVLIHCKRGADRTGLASVMARLLYTDDTLSAARRQLWPRYGHFRFGRTAAMDQFFDQYERWLAGRPHAPPLFREWATAVYTPGPARSELTWLDPVPVAVAADQGFAVRLRAVNRSAEPWELKPGDWGGIHLSYVVASDPLTAAHRGKAGLMRATVPPGGHVDFLVAVPPLLRPGRYALAAELTDARGAGVPVRANSFVQFGDAAALAEVVVK